MASDEVFATDPGEPLDMWSAPQEPPTGHSDLRALAIEYSSRGDRVTGRVLLPASNAAPCPLVLLQHGAGGAHDAPYLDAVGGPWARAGAAVVSIDFPLHGARASAKLSELLLGRFAGEPSSEAATPLAIEFVRQSTADLARAIDAAATLPDIDASQVVYAGISLGAMVGAVFCANDPRPRAAVFALAGGSIGPPEVDPVGYVARIAPRPVLFVNANDDTTVPRDATEKLFAAAAEPKDLQWFDGTHAALPGVALKAMWTFLRQHQS